MANIITAELNQFPLDVFSNQLGESNPPGINKDYLMDILPGLTRIPRIFPYINEIEVDGVSYTVGSAGVLFVPMGTEIRSLETTVFGFLDYSEPVKQVDADTGARIANLAASNNLLKAATMYLKWQNLAIDARAITGRLRPELPNSVYEVRKDLIWRNMQLDSSSPNIFARLALSRLGVVSSSSKHKWKEE